MATFKAVIRTNKDYNIVYIRVTHKGAPDYIKTEMIVHKSGIRKGDISDNTIQANCAIKIKSYIDKINNTDISKWTVKELKEFLTAESESISFSAFARSYIDKMIVAGRKHPANNYTSALNSLENHYRKEIYFSDITSKELRKWQKTLENTKRAKELYPILLKKMFDDGCLEYNDYDRNIIIISNQPFKNVVIPAADTPQKRSVDLDVLAGIFEAEPELIREELALDVAKIVFYLAGINTIDLYFLEKSELKNGKLCYNRHKTKKERKDKAYIEISIPDEISQLLVKYKGKRRLFNFSERYSDSDCFSTAVNKGLKSLCLKTKVQKITVYWLRHTWATIAQNKCGASTELVGFCLNHSSAHRTTEGYIKKDFSPIDKLNREVLDFIKK